MKVKERRCDFCYKTLPTYDGLSMVGYSVKRYGFNLEGGKLRKKVDLCSDCFEGLCKCFSWNEKRRRWERKDNEIDRR